MGHVKISSKELISKLLTQLGMSESVHNNYVIIKIYHKKLVFSRWWHLTKGAGINIILIYIKRLK